MTSIDLAYRKTAADGASGFGTLIALFDTLAGDLRRAAEAQRANEIAKRCHEVKHALRIVAHLDNWLAQGEKGALTQQLGIFYADLPCKLLDAQVRQSPELLEEQMREVLRIRGIWQKFEESSAGSQPEALVPTAPSGLRAYAVIADRRESSWSA